MKEVFHRYIEHSFGEAKQSASRMKQFEFNYRKYFPLDKDAKVLDIGIGRGEMLTCMKTWGYADYVGIDISPDTVSFCNSLALRCLLVEDTAEWLKGHEDSFDLVTLLDVLEHIRKEGLIPFLEAVRMSLRRGGVLILQVPNLQAPDGYLHRYYDITHEVAFVEHSLQQVLLGAGFRDFTFHEFEELIFGMKDRMRKMVRFPFWMYVRFTRIISANLNPRILSPVFYAVVRNH